MAATARRDATEQNGGAGRGDEDGGGSRRSKVPAQTLQRRSCRYNRNGKHLRREYNKVALQALEIVQASAGPATREEIHGATTHSAGRPW